MNFKRVLAAFALISVFALNFSCTQETVSETDEFYGIDKDEIKEEDT